MDFKNKPYDAKALKGKNIAVIGGGVEGKSSAKYLESKGAKVTVLDQKSGEDYLDGLDECDLIIRSPGINPDLLKGVPAEKITTQTNIFMELCPAKIIGVTGTKGKGTTSALIYGMLKKQGFDAYLGGNIGVPPFEFLDKLNTHSIVVLEMSSFQLMDVKKSPNIAVVLMITSEHLAPSKWQKNYHKNIDEYVWAKRNILRFQTASDAAVINKDYIASRESDIEIDGKIYYVSTEVDCEKGCFVLGNAVWIRDQDFKEKIINTSEILIPGKHNFENAAAASMAAYIAGVSIQNIANVLKTFKGLEHRLEHFVTINGARYYDDSIATNPESAIAAINAFKEPKILVLGGVTEGSDFSELGEVIAESESVKAIIGIGKEWPNIKSKIQNPKNQIYFIEGAKDMEQIVTAAYKIAAPGDVVLLSPACKSFDMFKSYKDRGDQFKKEVKKLKETNSN